MTTSSQTPAWATAAVLVGRLIFAAVFLMALAFKVMDIDGTAAYIASAGFPVPKLLAWLAALFELALAVCLLTGAFFAEAALLAAAYVLFLAFAFHGPSHWSGNQTNSALSFITLRSWRAFSFDGRAWTECAVAISFRDLRTPTKA